MIRQFWREKELEKLNAASVVETTPTIETNDCGQHKKKKDRKACEEQQQQQQLKANIVFEPAPTVEETVEITAPIIDCDQHKKKKDRKACEEQHRQQQLKAGAVEFEAEETFGIATPIIDCSTHKKKKDRKACEEEQLKASVVETPPVEQAKPKTRRRPRRYLQRTGDGYNNT